MFAKLRAIRVGAVAKFWAVCGFAKYLDREYCYNMYVENPNHAARILFMRKTALLHFEAESSPFWRRQVVVNRAWTPNSSAWSPENEGMDTVRPDFAKPGLRAAMEELGMLPSPASNESDE